MGKEARKRVIGMGNCRDEEDGVFGIILVSGMDGDRRARGPLESCALHGTQSTESAL